MSGSSSGSDSGGKIKTPRSRKKDRGQKVDLGSFLKTIKEPTEKAMGPTEEARLTSSKEVKLTAAVELAATAAAATATGTAVATATVIHSSTADSDAKGAAATSPKKIAAPTAKSVVPRLTEVVKAASCAAPPPNKTIMRPPLSNSKKGGASKTTTVPNSAGIVAGSSYAQQVSGSSKKVPYITIEGSYVAPCQPPADLGKSRPKSAAGLQGLFDVQWQDDRYGMYFEHLRGSAQSAYLRALQLVVPLENIFSFGLVGRGMVEVYTTTIDAATKLMLEGIDVGGRHLQPYPVSVKPTRVCFSRVPIRAKSADLENFLRRFGKVHGKVRNVPLKIGDEGLGRGILSLSREAYITLNQGCVLPDGFYWSMSGSKTWIEVSTEAKCHACHQAGHFIAQCPKRSRKVAEVIVEGTPAPAEAPKTVTSPGAAPTLVEHLVNEVTQETSKETTPMPAINGAASTRDEVVSSDEEHTALNSGRKRRKRKAKKKPDQEAMPPPAKKVTQKEGVPGEETGPTVSNATSVASEDFTDVLSDVEVVSAVETTGPTRSGYESCGSTVSIGSRFEVDPDLEDMSRAKLRSILGRLHYKKSGERILTILKQELGDPARILPQLKLLMKEAKQHARYNEVSRFERLYNKVSDVLEERRLEQALLP